MPEKPERNIETIDIEKVVRNIVNGLPLNSPCLVREGIYPNIFCPYEGIPYPRCVVCPFAKNTFIRLENRLNTASLTTEDPDGWFSVRRISSIPAGKTFGNDRWASYKLNPGGNWLQATIIQGGLHGRMNASVRQIK